VTLRVASGKVKVPTVVNLSRNQAQTTLTDAGLTYRTRFKFSSRDEGTVLSQTHSGDTVDVGTQIILVVAQRAAPTPTPPPASPAPTTTSITPPTPEPTTATTAP
jgi:beta-lactam-binding protein with PASTA domain